jgi:hypothetical protein
MFADTLDRIMFYIEIIGLNEHKKFYEIIEQMESDCYFITCFIWFQYHIRTLIKIWENGNYL